MYSRPATRTKNGSVKSYSFPSRLVLAWIGVLIVAAFAHAPSANSQSVFQGSISGTITDASGAAVPHAQVHITNEDTHFVTPATGNATGAFSAPFLTPGTYDIKIDAAGFATAEQTGVVVSAGQIKEVDFRLKISSANSSITVTANSELLETGSATVDTTLTSNVIQNSPLNGDVELYLATRLPGVYGNFVQGSEKSNFIPYSNGQIGSINGTNNRELLAYDGIMDDRMTGAPSNAGNPSISPIDLSTEQFSVKTAEFDAQYGHSNGGVYDVVLKNGTERFHGEVLGTEENTAYDANFWQRKNSTPQLPRPQANYTEEAFNVTGPLLIPHLYHGRTYFMVGYEHIWESLPQVTSNVLTFSVPTLKERAGDFSEINGAGGVIYDPTTTYIAGNPQPAWCSPNCTDGQRESFTQEYNEPNTSICNGDVNCIPQSRWNHTGAILAGALNPNGFSNPIYPAPNTTSLTPSTPYVGNYQAPHYALVYHFHGIVARVDHEFNENNKIHVSYSRTGSNQQGSSNQGFPDNELGSQYGYTLRTDNLTAVDFTRVINPTTVLDLHSGFVYDPQNIGNPGTNFNPTNLGISGGLPVALQNFPGVNAPTGIGGSYYQINGASGGLYKSYAWDSTAMVSKSHGRHNLKAGGELLMEWSDSNPISTLGTFSASNAFTQNYALQPASASTGYGDGIATELLGYMTGGGATINPHAQYAWHYYAGFLQDDWRVNDRMTLNLGVRYDDETVVSERQNQMNAGFNFNVAQPFCLPNSQGTAIASCAPPPTLPIGLNAYLGGLTFIGNGVKLPFQRELLDRFQPRVGSTYRITSRDVLRGGFGITVAPSPQVQSNDGFSATTPFTASTNSNRTPSSCTSAQGGDAYSFCTVSNPFPNGIVQPTGSVLGPSTFLGQGISIYDQNYSYPHTFMYVMGAQHQFPSQLMLDVSYHGAYTSGLGITKNVNALPACYYLGGDCPGAGNSSVLNASVPNPMHGYLPASSSLNGATISQQSLDVPYPEFGAINDTFTRLNGKRTGVINYNGLFVEVSKRATHGLDFHVSFTFQKVMDQLAYTNATDPAPAHYLDQMPSRFLEYDMVYHIPGTHSRNILAKAFLNGWTWSNSENWDQATGMGWPGGVASTGVDPRAPHQSQLHWFNNCVIPIVSQPTATSPAVYGQPYSYTIPSSFGGATTKQSGCNTGEQPAWIQLPNFSLNTLKPNTIMGNTIRFPEGVYVNTALAKSVPIHEGLSLTFRAECYNVPNLATIIGTFNATYSSPNFGEDTGPTQNNDPRFFRLKAILTF